MSSGEPDPEVRPFEPPRVAVARRILWWAGAPARLLLLSAIRLYRMGLAGLTAGRCRFHPSCSHYAEEAVRIHGAVRGGALAAWRILRCSPLTAGGLDPVPGRPLPSYDSVILRADRPEARA